MSVNCFLLFFFSSIIPNNKYGQSCGLIEAQVSFYHLSLAHTIRVELYDMKFGYKNNIYVASCGAVCLSPPVMDCWQELALVVGQSASRPVGQSDSKGVVSLVTH